MTIQQYLNKINTLYLAEGISEHLDNVALENLIIKTAIERNGIYFVLFKKVADNSIFINPEFMKQIAKNLDLLFVNEKESEGNVCFANSEELRPEFRQSFTTIDVLDYCYAILHSSIYQESLKNDSQKIPVPSDCDVFWRLVQFGSDLRRKEST
ncbi:type ISP restriction/modification enzyme [Flavobacterium sp. JAS]|uniref:type ISP restriction/modification enzyme n=1 Tax=Flavobacterium sp. JAS TaxID=2897329 RepID=UPI001E465E71|nr:type ISP restriction/modification enzyme [Flavobacterium sp. JAS]MCD0472378.1 hypothetical protein [Flavobacterium sp. JAS]